MNNRIKFNLNMIKKYEEKYPQMPTDILVDIIDFVLNCAPGAYFNFELVQDHQEFCIKCGICCRNIGCSFFNGRTCHDYDSRYHSCKEFPYYEIMDDTGLILDCECHFANRLAEMVLDEEFQKNLDLICD